MINAYEVVMIPGYFWLVHWSRSILEYNRDPSDLNTMSWCHWIPLKVRCFVWRVRCNKIPAKVSLVARGIGLDSTECSLCVGADESANHLMFLCPFSSKVWAIIADWCDVSLQRVSCIRGLKELSEEGVGSCNRNKAICSILMATCWFI